MVIIGEEAVRITWIKWSRKGLAYFGSMFLCLLGCLNADYWALWQLRIHKKSTNCLCLECTCVWLALTET